MINANNKYKTVMCKHFEQNGQCYLGAKCHFAHGQEELRSPSDPLPPMKSPGTNDNKAFQGYQGYSAPPNVSNYKTIKCRFFEKGHCKYGTSCSFAHGDQDIRSPNSPVPSHVLSNMQMNDPMMSSLYNQTTQNQIAQQQIVFLINQMEQYHSNDQDFLAKLKQATELNNSGNIQAAASLVYSIINRPNKTKEEEASYTSFTQQIQSYGSYLYQMTYSQNAGMYGFNAQAMMPNPMMGMGQPYGTNSDMNQPRQFGAPNPGSTSQGKIPNQNNQDQSVDNTKGSGQGGNESTNMYGLNNMMGNLQIGNQPYQNMKPYGGKPKNSYNKGNNKFNQG